MDNFDKIFIGVLLIFCLIIGTNVLYPAINKEGTGQIVQCSDYNKIVDTYKTPSGEYLQFNDGYSYQITTEPDPIRSIIGNYFSEDLFKGQYVKRGAWKAINLTELTEEESGMRDACRVEP